MTRPMRPRGTVTTASWIICSRRQQAERRVVGVERADAARMTAAPGLDQIKRFGAARLRQHDAIRAQPFGQSHERA